MSSNRDYFDGNGFLCWYLCDCKNDLTPIFSNWINSLEIREANKLCYALQYGKFPDGTTAYIHNAFGTNNWNYLVNCIGECTSHSILCVVGGAIDMHPKYFTRISLPIRWSPPYVQDVKSEIPDIVKRLNKILPPKTPNDEAETSNSKCSTMTEARPTYTRTTNTRSGD